MRTTYDQLASLGKKLTLGGNPLVAAALTGGAGYLGGSLLGPFLAKNFLLPKNVPFTPELKRRIKRRFGLLGLLGGAGVWIPPIYRNLQQKGFPEGLFSGMGKQSMFKRADLSDFIPAGFAQSTILGDEYLPLSGKGVLNTILTEAGNKAGLRSSGSGKLQGLLSTNDLISGAVTAGLGYGAGATAGLTLNKVFGLPPQTVRRLSNTGALAGLLYGTGIIS